MATADPTVVAHALHELEKAMLHIFASKCLAVAGVCILIYDHILTFPQEVELIWKQKRSWVSIFFVLNRYITPLVLAVDIYDKGGLASFLSQSFCVNWYYAESMWNLVAFGLIHGLVALRVHAIWGRPRWLSVTLSVLFAIYFVMTAAIAVKFEIQCLQHSKRKINTPVVHVLYRDGIVYFIIISICSTFNMMVWLLAPPTLVALSKYFVLSVVPTMGARLVLNLRGSRREDIMPTGKSTSADDNAVYEMHSKGTSTPSNRGVIFVSRGPDPASQGDVSRGLSAQDRAHLNQIKSDNSYYRLGSKEGKRHMV